MKYLLLIFFPLFLFGEASISVYAVNCKTNKVVLAIDENKSMIPASALKVVTTGAALHLLGPEATFTTNLEMTGEVKKGILHGNIIIRGGGDPTLGSNRCARSSEDQMMEWVQAIKDQGIKEIRGDVIGDASLWEKSLAPASWAWEDLGNYYGAGASALTFHENMYTLTFKPGERVGAPAILDRISPVLPELVLHNEVTTGPVGSGDQACIYGSEYIQTQVVRGTIPDGVDEFSIKGSIPDPALFCSELLKSTLQKNGIKVLSQFIPMSETRVIHSTQSPPVGEIIYWANQKSINLYAEHLLKAMGHGSTSGGLQSVQAFLDEQGINMVDGSGLSRKNFITSKQFATLLVRMKKSPHFSVFLKSLPEEIPGVFAKPGSMSHIRSLVGYKGEIAFAILINHGSDSKSMKKMIEEMICKLK